MSHYFLDSSGLIKRYLPEIGTRWIRQLAAASSGHDIIIAQITPVELVSVVARKQREQRVAASIVQPLLRLMDHHQQAQYMTIQLDRNVEGLAKILLVKHALRAADAMQLASAIIADQTLLTFGLPPLTFICADKNLLKVATAEGLQVDDPNNYP